MLDALAEKFKSENLTESVPVSYILVRAEGAQYYLKLAQAAPLMAAKARDYLDECLELVESIMTTAPPPLAIQASVYRISALYDKYSLNYSAFYRHTFLFLACLSAEEVKQPRFLETAHDLCVAALLADDIYNFGELLEHDILKNLAGSPYAFLADLLAAFNAGALDALSRLEASIKSHPALSAHATFLQEKLCLMSLAQFLFTQVKTDRRVSFAAIAAATKVAGDQIEFLLIRAISVGIIRGSIDQVEGFISVSWIQPRLLDGQQIGELLRAVETWNDKVGDTLQMVQQMRSQGAFNETSAQLI
jgi:26S proteasome regulatory subunit N9